MRLVEFVLKKVKDDKHLTDQILKSEAIRELVNGYNRLALQPARTYQRADDSHNSLYTVGGETYGSDLKRYIAYLPSADQLRLLNQYLSHFPRSDKGDVINETLEDADADHAAEDVDDVEDRPVRARSESPAEREDRKFRHWAMKVVIYAFLVFATLVIGAVIALAYRNHTMPDASVLKAIMNTATELLKILAGSPPSK